MVPELVRIPPGALHAGVGSQAGEDEVLDLALAQQEVEVGALEARAVPVLADDDVAVARDIGREPVEDLRAPAALGEGVRLVLRLVHVRHVRPALVETRAPLLVQAVVDGDPVRARRRDDLAQVRDRVVFVQRRGEERVQLAVCVEEVVVGVDEDDGGGGVGGRGGPRLGVGGHGFGGGTQVEKLSDGRSPDDDDGLR